MQSALIGKRLFCYIGMFAAVFFCCELATRFIVALDLPSMSLPKVLYLKYDLAARKPQPGKNVALFFGNSVTMKAVYPELVAARLADHGLNLEIRNLASSNATPQMDFALLRQAVEARITPAAVFYGLADEFLPKHPNISSLDDAFLGSYLYRCVSKSATTAVEHGRCLVERYSYFYRYRGYLKQLVSHDLWFMIADPERFNRKELWSQSNDAQFEVSNQGWSPSYTVRDRGDFQEYAHDNRAQWAAYDAQHLASTENLDRFSPVPDFEQLVAYCEGHGIPLVLMWMPGLYPLEEGLAPRHKAAELRVIADYAGRRHQVHVLEFPEDHDTWDYADRLHQNVFGSVQFSEKLAETLLQPFYSDLLRRHDLRAP